MLFFILSALALFIFRKRYPDRERPFRTWGYPVTPVVFMIIGLAMLINTFIRYPKFSIYGIIVLLLGIPVYLILFKGNERGPSDEAPAGAEGEEWA